MKVSPDYSAPPFPLGPVPAIDRRTLERMAVGAPPPTPGQRPRAIERGARVRRGWPFRPLPPDHITLPRRRPPEPRAPEIAIGRPRERPRQDLSHEPLYLLVPDLATWRAGLGADVALTTARRFAGGRTVILVDLDASHPDLSERHGGPDQEGIADVLEFGMSLDAVGRELEGGVVFVPLGTLTGDPAELYTHEGWGRVVRTARRRGDRILAYAPPGRHLDALRKHAGAALLLSRPEEEIRLRATLPAGLPVLGSFEPPAPAPGAATERAALPEGWGVAPAPAVTAAETHAEAEGGPAGPAGRGVQAGPDGAALAPGSAGPAPPESVNRIPPGTAGATDASVGHVAPWAPEEVGTGTAAADAAQVTTTTADERAGTSAAAPRAEPSTPEMGHAQTTASDQADVSERADASATAPEEVAAPDGHASAAVDQLSPSQSTEPEGGPEPHAGPERKAEPEPAAAAGPAPRPARPPEPPMLAPTARGLTLAEWLAEGEQKLRQLEAKPHFPPSPAEPGPADLGRRVPHRYSVPRTSPRAEKLIRVAAILILGYWTYYIGWRWTATLNPDALWFSIPLALAETWGWVTACFLVFTVWKLEHRKPPPAPPGLSVDVFITTFDEPLEVIRRTTISAREIRYPHNTYVLDDGRREDVRVMARALGVGYITRTNNEHAKAGNLNNALKVTSGDFILQLDADHAPLPHILDRLLGFFNDPRVAFVQTPQDFYNLDSFTAHVDEETQRVWEEQKLFFSVLQPGKDHWNSAFFCGSCGVLRRAALDEIGGFSVESVTEDVETSMLLHARGWKSVYYGESLAYGLAASSAAAFHIQQGRWAQGSMQILRKLNPLTHPGLGPAQRLGYFYSLSSFAVGLQKFIFYGSPLVFFFTGVLPIRALDAVFLSRFVPYLVLSLFLYELLARGLGFTWIAERYQMAKFWTYTRALPTYLTKRRVSFRVTPKGPSHVPFRTYAPHIALMVLTVVAVYWATFAYDRGWIDYPVPGWESLAFQVNFVWAVLNFTLAAYVVRLSIKLQHQRQDHRFSDRFAIHLQPRSSQGRLGERQAALTENLDANGLSFRSVSRFEPGTSLKLTLPLSTREVAVEATVVHVRPDRDPRVPAFIHGVEFEDLPADARDAIEVHRAQHAAPPRKMQLAPASSVSAARAWAAGRKDRYSTVRLPAWVLLGEGAGDEQRKQNVAFVEEVGPGGGSLIMTGPIPPETPIVFEVPGTEIRGEGHTTYAHALETPIGVRFVVGMRTARQTLTPSARGALSAAGK